jgi:signal transduction histidine kinase
MTVDLSRPWGVVRQIRSHPVLELVPAASLIGYGLVLLLFNRPAGVAGLLGALLLALEVTAGRPRTALALSGIAAIALSNYLLPTTPNPSMGLFFVAALVLPLTRTQRQTIVVTQVLCVGFLLAVGATARATGTALDWGQTLLIVASINAAAVIGYAMYASQRTIVWQKGELEARLSRFEKTEAGLRQALGSSKALREAVVEVRSQPDEAETLRAVTRLTCRIATCDATGYLAPGANGEWELTFGASQDGQRLTLDRPISVLPGSPVGDAVLRRESVWLTGPEVARSPWAAAHGVRVMGLVPILADREVRGVLSIVWWRTDHELTAGERELVEVLADQASAALEKVELAKDLAARADGAEMLHRITADVVGRRDVGEIAHNVILALKELYKADAGSLYLIETDETVRHLDAVGLPSRFVEQVHELLMRTPDGLAWRPEASQVIEDVPTDPRLASLRSMLEALGIASFVVVSARTEGQIVGGLVLYHRQRRVYRASEILLLEMFGGQLAGALSLARAYAALTAADRQREEFLALVSHELRQPVAAIATVAAVLSGTPGLGEAERRLLDGLRVQAQSLARFAEDVLMVARLEAGAFSLRPVVIDLGVLVSALVARSPDAERINVSLPPEAVLALLDGERLGQAVDNLLQNAVKYSPADKPIQVRLIATPYETRIEVEDQGVGLAPEELPQLFRKYGRITNARTSPIRGVGLGLYLTRLLVEAHNGQVTAASSGAGQGSTFTITLPARLNVASPSGTANGSPEARDVRLTDVEGAHG